MTLCSRLSLAHFNVICCCNIVGRLRKVAILLDKADVTVEKNYKNSYLEK